MIFNNQQINEILRIIDFQHAFFIGTDLGIDVLTDEDKNILRQFGINPEELKTDFTPYEQSFYFGRLSSALGNQAGKLDYNDFVQYLRRGQYIPLTKQEQNALDYVKRSSYNHIKNLGLKVRQDIQGIIIEEDSKKRKDYENLIQGSLEWGIEERRTASDIVLKIGNKTQDWGRDLGRIAETELQTAFETGRLEQILKEEGEDAMCYRDVFPGACRHCISLYLTGGIGSQPKLFKVKDIIANGTNIGKKTKDWLPTASSTHPFCFDNPNIKIYTSKGWKRIIDIEVGDLVLTHKGRFRRVTNLIFRDIEEYEYEVYNISFIKEGFYRDKRIQTIKGITQNHPILTDNGWVEVKKLKVGDVIKVAGEGCFNDNCSNLLPILTGKIANCVEADGENWHNKENDKKRDKKIKELINADIFRFSEDDIRNNGDKVYEELKRIIKNHKGEYGLIDFNISDISKNIKKGKGKRLYNFSVEEDESYIANGVVVHNCRCMWNKYDPDTIWSDEKRKFIEKPYERIIQRKSKVRIQIGDKELFV